MPHGYLPLTVSDRADGFHKRENYVRTRHTGNKYPGNRRIRFSISSANHTGRSHKNRTLPLTALSCKTPAIPEMGKNENPGLSDPHPGSLKNRNFFFSGHKLSAHLFLRRCLRFTTERKKFRPDIYLYRHQQNRSEERCPDRNCEMAEIPFRKSTCRSDFRKSLVTLPANNNFCLARTAAPDTSLCSIRHFPYGECTPQKRPIFRRYVSPTGHHIEKHCAQYFKRINRKIISD